jgi:hypothetical protein
MERADSADTTFGILAISIAECFGSESVSPELATSLKKVLPEATFLRLVANSFIFGATNMYFHFQKDFGLPPLVFLLSHLCSPYFSLFYITEQPFVVDQVYSSLMISSDQATPWSALCPSNIVSPVWQ